MATTNSTKKTLNKRTTDGAWYGKQVIVNTGNMAETDPYIAGGRYYSGKKKNMTYTLETKAGAAYEETGRLMDYSDGMYIDGEDTWVYGHPDKWVFDTEQRVNNCGVVSALNILSMAGKLDVDDVTKAEIEALKENAEEGVPVIIPVSQEEKLTLYAILHNYCNHKNDLNTYKSTANIQPEDGGSYLDKDMPMEAHQYHETIHKLNQLLADYGVAASTVDFSVVTQGNEEVREIEDKGQKEIKEPNPQTGEEETKTIDIDTKLEYSISKSSGHVSITSQMGEANEGNDTLIFTDQTKEDIMEHPYLLIKDGNDLVISYYGPYSVRIKNYFVEPGASTDDAQEIEPTHINYIQFNNDPATKQTLASFIEEVVQAAEATPDPNDRGIWGSAALESNIRRYGKSIQDLSDYIKEGRGIILSGYGEGLKDTQGAGTRHAITVVGVKEGYVVGSDGDEIRDVLGFYVVDSGGWLQRTGGAQYISCQTLYNFLTNCKYLKKDEEPFEWACYMSLTDECIKSWADELNITGNAGRNTLYGNESRNIIRGGGSVDNLYGEGGDDTIYGDAGDDWLSGGEGNNILNGGVGNDTYVFSSENGIQADAIIPGSGKDTLRFEDQLVANLNFFNKNGDLIVYYNNGNSSVTVKDYFKKGLYTSIAKLDDEQTIEARVEDNQDHSYNFLELLKEQNIQYEINGMIANTIPGSVLDDNVVGGNRNDTIRALNGDDIINGGNGDDIIYGGNGDDTVISGYGNNRIYGEAGVNIIKYEGDFSGYDTIYSGAGKDYIELKTKERADLSYSRKGNDLIVTYDDAKGSSFRITNYFSKFGNTSVRQILLDNDSIDMIHEYPDIVANLQPNFPAGIVGGNGNDTLTGTPYGNVMNGAKGEDIIKGGAGNDTITGGLGSDTLYGMGGSDTFKFNSLYDGSDTIYSSGNGLVTFDFSNTTLELEGNTGFVGGYHKYANGDGNFAYTKVGNNLVINYGLTAEQESMSRITLMNYFSSKNIYHIKTADQEYDLANAMIYTEGRKDAKNNITGTAKNDLIYGGDLNDNLRGAAGNDIFYSGLGNDTITGGLGNNKIMYTAGDGLKTVTLTKNENLDIVLDNTFGANNITYEIDKTGNLLIKNLGETIVNLRGFGKTDVTGTLGSVKLYIENDLVKNLSTGMYLDEYSTFSALKKSYTGTWHAETINASGLGEPTSGIDKGISINGGAGNDIILGSNYNDTLMGGLGNDVIYGGKGKNTLDGGAGADTYMLFHNNIKNEDSTIKDSGKPIENNVVTSDKALIFTDKDSLQVVFNITKAGKVTNTFTVTDKSQGSKNKATITGVEQIYSSHVNQQGGVVNDYRYDYNNAQLRANVVAWLANNPKYADVNAVMTKGTDFEQNTLLAFYQDAWTAV